MTPAPFQEQILVANKEELIHIISCLKWDEKGSNSQQISYEIDRFLRFFQQQRDLFTAHFGAFYSPVPELEKQESSKEIRYFNSLQEMVGHTFTFQQYIWNGQLEDATLPTGPYILKETVISALHLQHGDRLLVKKCIEQEDGSNYLEFEVAERLGQPVKWREVVSLCHIESMDGTFYITGDHYNQIPKKYLPVPLSERDVAEFELEEGDIVKACYNPLTSQPRDKFKVIGKYDLSIPNPYNGSTTPSPMKTKRKSPEKSEKETIKGESVWSYVDISLFRNLRIVVLGGDGTPDHFATAQKELKERANCDLIFISCDHRGGSFLQTAEREIKASNLLVINTFENRHSRGWNAKDIADRHGVTTISHMRGSSVGLIHKLHSHLEQKVSNETKMA